MKFSAKSIPTEARRFALAALVATMPLLALARSPGFGGLGALPLSFEPCQTSGPVPIAFQSRGLNYQIGLTATEAQIVLTRLNRRLPDQVIERRQALGSAELASSRLLRIKYPNANADAMISSLSPSSTKVSYLTGRKPEGWRAGLPTFERVAVQNLYPGIDLVYYGNQQRLEYDFHVQPGADPAAISLQFQGADRISLDADGNLIISLGEESIVQHRPQLYQIDRGLKKPVVGSFELRENATVHFHVGDYDHTLPLVIDPVLSYATYFGGNDGDLALSVKLDGNGFIYIAGQTLSPQFSFPIPAGAFQSSFAGGKINGDAFVVKIDPTGSSVVYFTYLGGSGNDGALDLAVTTDGYAYLTGFTDSTNFPTIVGSFDQSINGPPAGSGIFFLDAFVAKLDPSGAVLVYSTYIGGSDIDSADAIAVDPSGNAYITGYTFSRNFPLVNPIPGQVGSFGPHDAFVTKIAADGSSLLYSTYLGGANVDEGQGIAVSPAGYAYVTGYTASTNFPTSTNAFRRALNGSPTLPLLYDAFVTSLTPTGNSFAFSTLLGGTNNDLGFRVALDAEANAYVTGGTKSVDFPNTATNTITLGVGFTNTNAKFVNYDPFVTKVSPDGVLSWSTRFGGDRDDIGWDVALDANSHVFVTGITSTTNFPTLNGAGFPALYKERKMTNYVFVTALATDASSALYSLYFGGSRNDEGYGLAVDPAGNAYVVGRTLSTNFPTVAVTPLQANRASPSDAFLAKISLEPTLVSSAEASLIDLSWRAFAPEYQLERSSESSPGSAWAEVPAPAILSNGWHKVQLGPTNEGGFFRLRRARPQ